MNRGKKIKFLASFWSFGNRATELKKKFLVVFRQIGDQSRWIFNCFFGILFGELATESHWIFNYFFWLLFGKMAIKNHWNFNSFFGFLFGTLATESHWIFSLFGFLFGKLAIESYWLFNFFFFLVIFRKIGRIFNFLWLLANRKHTKIQSLSIAFCWQNKLQRIFNQHRLFSVYFCNCAYST